MAAEIKPIAGTSTQFANSHKPQLISKLEGHQDVINMAVIVPNAEGVISVSDDKLVAFILFYLICYTLNILAFMYRYLRLNFENWHAYASRIYITEKKIIFTTDYFESELQQLQNMVLKQSNKFLYFY